MKLDREQVEHVARLARLELAEDEAGRYAHQLSDVLTHMEALGELDTDGVEPTSHVLPLGNVMREDEPGESLSLEEALANAPDVDQGCFRVPRIVEE